METQTIIKIKNTCTYESKDDINIFSQLFFTFSHIHTCISENQLYLDLLQLYCSQSKWKFWYFSFIFNTILSLATLLLLIRSKSLHWMTPSFQKWKQKFSVGIRKKRIKFLNTQLNKYGRGTERHLPKTDTSVVRPAGECCYDMYKSFLYSTAEEGLCIWAEIFIFISFSSLYVFAMLTRRPDDALVCLR